MAHLIEMADLLAAERVQQIAAAERETHKWLVGIGYYSAFAGPRVSVTALESRWISELMATEGRWNA